MRELIVENNAIELAESTGWLTEKMQYVGKKGCRDRDFYKGGYILMVEFKQRGKPLDGHQVRRKNELAAKGHTVHVIDTDEGFVKLLGWAEGEIRRRREADRLWREANPMPGPQRPPVPPAIRVA